MAEFWCSSVVQLTNNVKPSWAPSNFNQNWAGFSRAFRWLIKFLGVVFVSIFRSFLFAQVLSVCYSV